jgi:hypothetical protein
VAVHTILPPLLTDAVDAVLQDAGESHVAHGDADPVGAATAAAHAGARAVIGPFRSRDVAEAVEVTARSSTASSDWPASSARPSAPT